MRPRLASALGVAGMALAAAPLAAQAQPAESQRAEAFAELPYWPGYWVSEGQAGTTIGGFAPATLAAREGAAPPTIPTMLYAIDH